MKPTGLLPAAIRASLTAAITAAKIGAEADVPPERTKLPFSAMMSGKLGVQEISGLEVDGCNRVAHPFAETSGYALPDLLKTEGA